MSFCLGIVLGASLVLLFTLCVAAKQGDKRLDDARDEFLRASDGTPLPKTAHSLNPVHFILFDPKHRYAIDRDIQHPGLGNNAATLISLLGFEVPEKYLPSLVRPR